MPAPKIVYDVVARDKSAAGFHSFSQNMQNAAGKSSRFTKIAEGFDKLSMGKLGASVTKFTGNVGQATEGLVGLWDVAGLGGAFLGAAGGLAAGFALAAKGAYDFVSPIAQSAVQLTNQSRVLGLSTRETQIWSNASRLGGQTADDMTTALGQMGRTMNDARFGRNNAAASLFKRLNITATDSRGAILQLADAFQRLPLSVQSKATIADALGVGGITAQLLDAKALRDNLGAANVGVSDADLKKLSDFQKESAQLNATWTTLKANIGSNLIIPWLEPTLKGVNTFVTNLSDPNHWKSLERDSSGRLRMAGSHKDGGHFHAHDAASGAPDAGSNPVARALLSSLTAAGFTGQQARGVVAGVYAETAGTFDPTIKNPGSTAFGLGQWTKSSGRQDQFASLFGKDIHGSTSDEQIQFLLWEMTNSRRNAGLAIQSAGSATEANRAYIDQMMAPGYRGAQVDYAASDKFLGQSHQLDVNIKLSGAPQGTIAMTSASSPHINPTVTVGPMDAIR